MWNLRSLLYFTPVTGSRHKPSPNPLLCLETQWVLISACRSFFVTVFLSVITSEIQPARNHSTQIKHSVSELEQKPLSEEILQYCSWSFKQAAPLFCGVDGQKGVQVLLWMDTEIFALLEVAKSMCCAFPASRFPKAPNLGENSRGQAEHGAVTRQLHKARSHFRPLSFCFMPKVRTNRHTTSLDEEICL